LDLHQKTNPTTNEQRETQFLESLSKANSNQLRELSSALLARFEKLREQVESKASPKTQREHLHGWKWFEIQRHN